MGRSKQFFFPSVDFQALEKLRLSQSWPERRRGKIQRACLRIPTCHNLEQLILAVALQTDLRIQSQELVSGRLLFAGFDLHLGKSVMLDFLLQTHPLKKLPKGYVLSPFFFPMHQPYE